MHIIVHTPLLRGGTFLVSSPFSKRLEAIYHTKKVNCTAFDSFSNLFWERLSQVKKKIFRNCSFVLDYLGNKDNKYFNGGSCLLEACQSIVYRGYSEQSVISTEITRARHGLGLLLLIWRYIRLPVWAEIKKISKISSLLCIATPVVCLKCRQVLLHLVLPLYSWVALLPLSGHGCRNEGYFYWSYIFHLSTSMSL